jgi:hypothetical protein
MGFELDGPFNMFGDNQSVVLNTTIPSSQFKKKIHACAYHRVREMITCRAIRFIHSQSNFIVADVLTMPLGGFLHRRLIEPILCGDGIPEFFWRQRLELDRIQWRIQLLKSRKDKKRTICIVELLKHGR